MELHPYIAPFAFLVGTWRGEGRGEYPTISPFGYGEEVTFTHVGKPFLAYTQRTWSLDAERRPMHAEAGYVRPTAQGDVEWVLAHPTGIAEILIGALDGQSLRFASSHVTATPSAKPVEAVSRELVVEGDELRYEVHMAAAGQPMTFHLSAALRRVGDHP